MNVDIAVVIERHLMRRAESERSDLVVQSGSGLTNVDQVSLATRTY